MVWLHQPKDLQFCGLCPNLVPILVKGTIGTFTIPFGMTADREWYAVTCTDANNLFETTYAIVDVAVYAVLDLPPAPTNTPYPTATSSPTPPATSTPIPNATQLPTATPTNTATPTATPTATNTPIPTNTPTGLYISKLVLIDANSDTPIAMFDPLEDGDVLDVSILPTDNFNIEAHVSTGVGSVIFSGDFYRTENVAPYTMFGDSNGDYLTEPMPDGYYTLVVTPYSGSNGSGTAGTPRTINFTVVNNSAPTNTPTASPTYVPTDPPGGPSPTPTFTPTPTNTPSGSCAGLVQEAESGTLIGNFVVGNDAGASGGQYIHLPEGTGSNWSYDTNLLATYCFTVTTPGTYQLKGWVKAPDGGSNSFFVKVNDAPTSAYYWNTLTAYNYFQPDYLNDHTSATDPIQLVLGAGTHSITVSPREDGTQLDKLELELITASGPTATPTSMPTNTPSPTSTPAGSCAGLIQEAENGTLSGDFVVASDGNASGGSYVHVPNGTGDNLSGFDSNNMVSFCVNIPISDTYKINAVVNSPSFGANTFYVQMDGTPVAGYIWEFPSNSQAYVSDYVSEKNGADPLTFFLSAGQHTFSVSLREDGARLDKIEFEAVGSGASATTETVVQADEAKSRPVQGPPTKAEHRAKVSRSVADQSQNIVPELTIRKTYSLNGQVIAQRTVVQTDGINTSNNLHFLYGDHLGSATTMTDANGTIVHEARFLPFGDYRTEPVNPLTNEASDLTELGYTGHHMNNYIKLVYMNSRWYDPNTNRMLNPDSIIPDPTNPQAYNRYSYAYNNPLKYTDPDGHEPCPSGNGLDCLPPPTGNSGENETVKSNTLPICVNQFCTDVSLPSSGRVTYDSSNTIGSSNPPSPELANFLAYAGVGADGFELLYSANAAAVHGFFTAVGATAAAPTGPAGEGGVALLSWVASKPADFVESLFSWTVDAPINIFGDIFGGTTYLDQTTNELVVGQDTIAVVAENLIDAVPYGPANLVADTVINAGAISYDIGKVSGTIPNFVEVRYRWSGDWNIIADRWVVYDSPYTSSNGGN